MMEHPYHIQYSDRYRRGFQANKEEQTESRCVSCLLVDLDICCTEYSSNI